jgi:hypothetical protein
MSTGNGVCGHRGSISGDGDTSALANPILFLFLFSGMATGMSVTAVMDDCDEKSIADKGFAACSQ